MHAAKVRNRNHQLFFRWSNSAKPTSQQPPRTPCQEYPKNTPAILTVCTGEGETPTEGPIFGTDRARVPESVYPKLTQEREDSAEAAFGTGAGGQEIFRQNPS
uniref:(northern house mosquito) hypothetical protein n=1 Tax=Culex pipiens TaxID=7175 RepID=A0A8D8CDK6_CULPI